MKRPNLNPITREEKDCDGLGWLVPSGGFAPPQLPLSSDSSPWPRVESPDLDFRRVVSSDKRCFRALVSPT